MLSELHFHCLSEYAIVNTDSVAFCEDICAFCRIFAFTLMWHECTQETSNHMVSCSSSSPQQSIVFPSLSSANQLQVDRTTWWNA